MVPRPRLILLTFLVALPLLELALAREAWLLPGFGVLLLILMVILFDGWRGTTLLKNIRLLLPHQLQLVQGRAAELVCSLENQDGRRAFDLRIALALPAELRTEPFQVEVRMPAEAGRHEFAFTCVSSRRGFYEIDGGYYEAWSPLGLWDVRGHTAQTVTVRVYPNIDSERKQIASLLLRMQHSGAARARQVGQGREFEKLREYVPGDGFNTIHWKASARRRHPITKVFQIEKMQEVYVIVDASRLSARLQVPHDPTQGTHLDRYISAALILGLAAEKQGDLFGLVTFSNRVLNFVRARNGKEHYGACREVFYRLQPQSVSPDFHELATFIRLRLRRRALVIFFTELDDSVLMEAFREAADLICQKHLVLIHMLQPDNIRPLFTRADTTSVDEIYQDLAQHFAWNDLRRLGLGLRQQGIGFSLFPAERFGSETISSYLRVKRNQRL